MQRLPDLTYVGAQSEGDVELRVARPLLKALGWPDDEIHAKVPMMLGRRKPGRNPEADLAVAPATYTHYSDTPTYIVIEAKRPGEWSTDAGRQAISYALMLRAAYALVTDGRHIQLWDVGILKKASLLIETNTNQLDHVEPDLFRYLSRASLVRLYNRENEQNREPIAISSYMERTADQYRHCALFVSRTLAERNNRPGAEAAQATVDAVTGSSLLLDHSAHYVTGHGGRGKSSIVQMLALASIRATPQRVPFLVDGADLESSTILEIVESALWTSRDGESRTAEADVWLRNCHTSFLFDNWDRASPLARTRIEKFITDTSNSPTCVLIAGRPSTAPPNLGAVRHWELGGYSEAELSQAVELALRASSTPKELLAALQHPPLELEPLLAEPVVFDQYHAYVATGTRAKRHLVLADLLDNVVKTLLTTRHAALLRRVDETTAVNMNLSHRTGPFAAADVYAALRAVGLDESASSFAEEMCDIGVWSRHTAGVWRFSHELWRYHYQSKAIVASGETPASWLAGRPRDDLQWLVVLLSSYIADRAQLATFTKELLRQDVELYMRALQGKRSSVGDDLTESEQESCLAELRDGYIDFSETFAPGFRQYVWPWRDFSQRESPIAAIGTVSHDHISYTLVESRRNSTRVQRIVVDARLQLPEGISTLRSIDLRMRRAAADSGRLIAAETLMSAIAETAWRGRIPLVGSIATEAALAVARCLATSKKVAAMGTLTVGELSGWLTAHPRTVIYARRYTGSLRTFDTVEQAQRASRRDLDVYHSLEIAAAFEGLSNEGLVVGLALPSPKRGGQYSVQQAMARAKSAMESFIATYRELIGVCAPGLRRHSRYGDGPYRGHAIADRGFGQYNDGTPFALQYWWEPCEREGEQASVVVGDFIDYNVIQHEVRAKAEALGRQVEPVVHHGDLMSWRPDDPAITQMVRRALRDDLTSLRTHLARKRSRRVH
jgi:energy-coupling factor transporter ATP-binding protein EcfA2